MKKDMYSVSTSIGEYEVWLPLAEQDYIQKSIATSGRPYEYQTLLESLRWIPQDGTVIDAGGNIGNHSLFWALYGANVEYFEPFEELVAIAEKNFELNNVRERVTVHQSALGDVSGKATLDSIDESNLGATKILPAENGSISIGKIDDLDIKALDFLKIDVEGFELNVLNGAIETIARTRPVVLVETIDIGSLEQISDFFLPHHYIFWDTYNATPTQLLVPKEAVSLNAISHHSMKQMVKRFKQEEMHSDRLLKLRAANEKYRNVTKRLNDFIEEARQPQLSEELIAESVVSRILPHLQELKRNPGVQGLDN